jgi:hypothetical protein
MHKSTGGFSKCDSRGWVNHTNMGHITRDAREYITVIAEVYFDCSKRKIVVRPCAGQSYPQTMNIECAREIRNYPQGTIVRLKVVKKRTYGIKPHLYSSYRWKHDVVTEK